MKIRVNDVTKFFLSVAIFFLSIEIGARVYHSIKYKDPSGMLHGKRYIENMIKEMKGWRGGNKSAYIYDANDAERVFADRRRALAEPIAEREPVRTVSFGEHAYFNKYGLRNHDVRLDKDPGVVRIMTIGSSFVEGVGVGDTDTWEYRLNEKLKSSAGAYEVINAGQGGTTINENLAFLISHVIKFKPDHIMLFSAYNNNRLIRQDTKMSLDYVVSTFLYNVSRFYAMLREKVSLKVFKDNNFAINNFDVKVKKSDVDRAVIFYRARLEEVYTICRENNVKLIVGLEPIFIPNGLRELQNIQDEARIGEIGRKLEAKGHISHYELQYYLQGRFNFEMERFAKERSIPLFDAITIFPEDKYPYFIDSAHPNPKGSEIIAEALCKFLRNIGAAQ